ncbi:MAG: sulfur oxidation protein [Halothiobacillus sp. 24-54-40]|nr:sulfur oxygenase reductase family protein [Halothiobacillaceae bacterium]OYV47415.1 MAG: sulfur oxidation protein [Halothiobacillus sp. 20-53-49]OYY41157.1 MAG: sulfur oxidation protein [Halothiobacillus sp. 35-54-62]OYZ87510.1 MAG: sulfur oxidation protein [Halothiobacillus sp. 24-54-40]OZA81081.1 MAG: sulfur oxidation protein [Halothiobacillus sp. 39-53-45]HQS01616.1 sulfur oxygenase reductase family protein [Halothiobacillus sp.]
MSSNPVIAINQAKIANIPGSYETMMKIGPKVCITTASHPSFLGFEQLLQTGIHPMAGRYGGGAVDMSKTLNPVAMYQYTVWKDAASHEEMHHDNFNEIYELCGGCLDMVIEGPWEPLYEIIKSDLPQIMGMTDVPKILGDAFSKGQPVPKVALASQRTIAIGEHWVMDGHEKDFEAGAIATLTWMKENIPGMIGFMLLKQFGVSAIGSFQLDPEGAMKATLGANPPKYGTNYGSDKPNGPPIPAQTPTQYLVHMEWESPDHAHMGIAHAMVDYELRTIHNEGVMRHLDRGPYYMFFAPMMEQGLWRRKLVY